MTRGKPRLSPLRERGSRSHGSPLSRGKPPVLERLVHATCVAIGGRGVLLRGASGSGKSDLALRLIDQGAKLVSDDQVRIIRQGEKLVARAPRTIAGKIEVRGIGIVAVSAKASVPVALVVDLTSRAKIERMPTPQRWRCLGRRVPKIRLDAFEASALAKLRLAVRLSARDSSRL